MLKRTVLVVAAHPDDEVLGCGGTIALHLMNEDEVYILFMSDGVSSRIHINNGEIKKRKQNAINASSALGVENKPIFLDNRMDQEALLDIVQPLEKIIYDIRPEVVYTHHIGDLNIDHQITHKAVMTACRPQPEFCVKEIYTFEVLSSTRWNSQTTMNIFTPNVFIDITKIWRKKTNALFCYKNELREFPHARSYKGVEALANYRGVSVGVEYAEAFQLERKIKHAS